MTLSKERQDELYQQGYEVGKQKVFSGHWHSPTGITREEYDWWWNGFCAGVEDALAKVR